MPDHPILFAKWPTALIGPGDPIRLPRLSAMVDYEAELAVVIGTRVRGIDSGAALEAVRGYACANDVTARDLQRADRQFTRSKSLDTFCPVGELVPAAAVPDPQALRIRCLVNGEVRQDSTTADMLFSVAELIAFASEAITLEPGDLLLTGTPEGRRCLPRPAGLPRRRRRGHGRDRRPAAAHESRPRLGRRALLGEGLGGEVDAVRVENRRGGYGAQKASNAAGSLGSASTSVTTPSRIVNSSTWSMSIERPSRSPCAR